MNKHYLKHLAGYQAINMTFYVLLSAIFNNHITIFGLVTCFALGVVVHRYFGYKGRE